MSDVQPCCCGGAPEHVPEHAVDAPRRRIIQFAVAGFVAPGVTMAAGSDAALAVGDRLVEDDAEGAPKPLTPADLQVGKPLLAFPFDGKAPKNGSRLNKVMLIKLAEADLEGENKARSAGGVIAFSALCTHQACDIKTWLSKEKAAICFCHASKFKLLEGGVVVSGPAQRPLPSLPLKLDGGQLVVAGGFSSAPGGTA